MRLASLLIATATAALAFASPSGAQTTPAFRVPLGKSSSTSTASAIWMWQQQVSSCSNTCGSGTRATTYVCQNAADYDYSGAGYGVPEADAQCVSAVGAKPSGTSQSCTVYSGCGYDWVKPAVVYTPMQIGSNPIGRVGCGQVRAQFSPYCKRSDGTVMSKADYAFCKADMPDYADVAANKPDAFGYDRVETQNGSCNTTDHEWVTGAWSAWSNTCSTSATHTRSVTCRRKYDGATVADSSCDASTRPAASENQEVYSSCSYTWKTDAWSAPTSTCSASAIQTRSVWCNRDQTGQTVTDSFCTSTRPAASQPAPTYSSCTYSATNWSGWTYASACSSNTSRTQTAATCLRSDGTSVAATECTTRGIAMTKTETGQANYASCTYSWQNGAWSASSSTCSSNATQTRAVWCRRDQTGETVADTSCNASTRPTSSQQVADYSTCSYAIGGWTAWSYASTCSSNTTRTSNATSCIRSDGTPVSLADCSSRGIAVTRTEGGQANYSSCTYSWQAGGWSGSSNTCSANATQTRAVWCRRDQTGETVGDTACNPGTRPASSQQVVDYSTCSYSWQTGGWSAPSNTCSSNATQTRAVWCRRDQTGETVGDASCTAWTRPASSQQVANYSTCSYSWGPATYVSDWDSHCSGNAYRYIDHSCIRSDGATVSTTYCDQAGIGHRENQNAAIYDGCSYYGGPWWGDWSWDTTCSSQAHRTQHRTCMRSDGTPMPSGSYCTDRGIPVSDTVTEANYSGCSYSVGPGWGWSDWNSHCSGNAYREQGHSCIRSDGYVDNNYADNECSRRGMTTWDRQWAGVYDGCGYSAVNWSGWSACNNGTQSQSAQCQRSDGAIVSNSDCNNRGISTYQTQSCARTCVAGWSAEHILYIEDSFPGVIADQNAAGKCMEGQGGHAASSNGNIQECWTRVVTPRTVMGRTCG